MANQQPDPDKNYKTPQPTLEGYDAWVLKQLCAATGKLPSRAAAWIINRWITESSDFLETQYGITNKDFRDGNVIEHPSSAKRAQS